MKNEIALEAESWGGNPDLKTRVTVVPISLKRNLTISSSNKDIVESYDCTFDLDDDDVSAIRINLKDGGKIIIVNYYDYIMKVEAKRNHDK